MRKYVPSDFMVDVTSNDIDQTSNVYVKVEDLPRWIPVSERLPEDGQRVLCYDPCICEDDWIALVAFTGGKFVGESSDGQPMYDYEPTHWMPLPEPPLPSPPVSRPPETRQSLRR